MIKTPMKKTVSMYLAILMLVLILAFTLSETVNASFQPFDARVNITSGFLNVRSGPGTNFQSVGQLANNAQVRVIGESGNWWQIGTNQWVSKDFIVPIGFQAFDGWVSVTSGTLNVRSGPGTTFSVVDSLANGTQVRVIGESGNWWQIGTNRWVSKDFITRTRPGSGISFVWPMPTRNGTNAVNSPFGNRIHPIHGDLRLHTGIDIPANTGERVNSMASGTVIDSSFCSACCGNRIYVRHSNNYSSRYLHLHSRSVNLNNTVTAGQQIGGAGTTGSSTGVHLHFEIRNRGGTAINPLEFWHPHHSPQTPNPNPVYRRVNGTFTPNTSFTWP